MEKGKIIEFFDEKRLVCAYCLEDRGDKLHVLTESNRELTLSKKRVIFSSAGPPAASLSRQQTLEYLKDVAQRRQDFMRELHLEEVWELLVDEAESQSAAQIARLWYGEGVSADQIAALGRALFGDRFYFKHKSGAWQPHPPEVVEQLKEQFQREAQRQEDLKIAAGWLRAAWQTGQIADPVWRERLTAVLKDLALFGPEAASYQTGKEFLEKAELTKPDAPFLLLVKLGVFHPDENLDLLRLQVPVEFPLPALTTAASVAGTNRTDLRDKRLDLTTLELFTIDGELTRDFDDALSLRPVAGGWELGVHIADVASCVRAGEVLDEVARQRGTSIYLPERRIPMFPEILSENILSLIADEVRCALSFLVCLDEQGEILNWRVAPSLIRVGRRLTYRQAVDLVENDGAWSILHRLSLALRERRLAQGGIHLHLPEVKLFIDPRGDVMVEIENTETPGHQIVSEAMVLANSLAARLLAESRTPAIYRSQGPPREALPQEGAKSLWQLWQDRRKLSRMVLDLDPQPHWGLGLPQYTTLSSPIRRYLDLIINRQVLALLTDTPLPYSRENLEEFLTELEPALRRAAQLKFRRQRYWLLKYLSRREGQKLEALVLDRQPHRYRLLLPDVLLEVDFPPPAALTLHPGDAVMVRIDRALPRDDVVKVSLA